ncbi:hypothetical protein G4B88_001085 [Cannabis sativa]|uniref:CCHC-type domain-containing protein n=1 Tax=Cannabis sativa TaxID=3483 RepID=A0A7J6DN69_CANSA|nr:hypothetical protein G4B88_001085 [Cannabis sativa]
MDEDKEHNYFGLSFHSGSDAKRILEKNPWLFNGGVLVLEEWPSSGQWRDARLDKVSIWVKMRGFPLKALTVNNVKRLGSMAGGEVFAGRYIPVDGGRRWVQFKFDKLPLLCFKCGYWGHDQIGCRKELAVEVSITGSHVPKYGAWLRHDDPIPNCFVAYDQKKDVVEGVSRGKEVIGHSSVNKSKGKVDIVNGMGPIKIEDEGDGRKRKCGRKVIDAAKIDYILEGETMVEEADAESFVSGTGMEVHGMGQQNKERRKCVSIKNKARAKAKVGGVHSDDIKLQVLSSSPGHILATVAGSGFSPWYFIGFYGNPEANQRSLSEKVGGRDRLTGAMDGFKEVIDDCRFIDFKEWLNQFEGADISLLDWWESDHRALVVDMSVRVDGAKCGKSKRKSRFHFEEAWYQEEECAEIVDRMWKDRSGRGWPSSFRCKVNKCGKALHGWNKKKKLRLNY